MIEKQWEGDTLDTLGTLTGAGALDLKPRWLCQASGLTTRPTTAQLSSLLKYTESHPGERNAALTLGQLKRKKGFLLLNGGATETLKIVRLIEYCKNNMAY